MAVTLRFLIGILNVNPHTGSAVSTDGRTGHSLLLPAFFLAALVLGHSAHGAESGKYSREFIQTLVAWGYKSQGARLMGKAGSPAMVEALEVTWAAVKKAPEAKLENTAKLALSLNK